MFATNNPYGQPLGGNLGFGNLATRRPKPETTAAQPAETQPAPSMGGNPYTGQQGQEMARIFNNNLTRNVLPAVRSGAQMAGQYGSSRQGIAEGLAMSDANQQLSGALAGLYSNQYNTDQQVAASKYASDNSLKGSMYGADKSAGAAKYNADKSYDLGMFNARNNYDLGLRGNQLANDQLDWNIDQGNYNRGVTNLGLGVGLINQGLAWQDRANQIGSNVQNAPLNYWNQFMNQSNATGGVGGTSNTNMPGNPLMGAVGGAALASQIYKNFGFGG